MMQGDLNKAQGHPHSPTHTHTHTHNHTCMHTHTQTFSHINYAGEKYINICITKQYKGLSVVKYLFCQIKTWRRRIRVGCRFLMSSVCKTISPFAFNKIFGSHLWKIFPRFNGIRGTGLYLYTQKVPPPPPQSLFSKMEAKNLESYMI